MKVGIVGLPNAGKSSLFNALTKAGAEAANYPFTTIEPNVAVVPVRDERLDRIAEVVGSSEVVYDTIDFHDIAGLVAGAHKGEGLGNRFVANIDEGDDAVPGPIAAHAAAQGAAAVAVSSRLEAELAELDDDEAASMRGELGVAESGLDRVVHGAFALLHLLAFFTAGEAKPAQSWHLRKGLTAWHAAGEIHSDIQRGFVRAEVIGWEALVDAGGYARARERGVLRLEGRDYVMADGDVITVRFTP